MNQKAVKLGNVRTVETSTFMLLMAATLVIAGMCMHPGSAMAFTTPADGDMFYDIYDIFVHKIFGGPIGIVIAFVIFILGLIMLFNGKMVPPLIAIAVAVILPNIENLITSLGFSAVSTVSVVQTGSIVHSISAFLL